MNGLQTKMRMLNIDQQYPLEHHSFIQSCHEQGQVQATPLILNYSKGGFNTLHQDLYGPVHFPLQMVIFLSEYGEDHEGGAFVMTEQIPRSQSKPMVIQPAKGDALIFATSYRPVKGQKGYYRANLRHGVSEVISGRCESCVFFRKKETRPTVKNTVKPGWWS